MDALLTSEGENRRRKGKGGKKRCRPEAARAIAWTRDGAYRHGLSLKRLRHEGGIVTSPDARHGSGMMQGAKRRQQ